MKKTAVSLALLMALGLTACGAEPSAETAATTAATTTVHETAAPETAAQEEHRSLVLYFSATGNTAEAARGLADQTGAELRQIVPEEAYTADDLNYNDDSCRANREMNDPTARPAIAAGAEGLEDYDVIYLGFPIWWGTMPRIINTLADTGALAGKTVMPFCTSGGSGISAAVEALREAEPEADVRDGLRLSGGDADRAEIESWLGANALGENE